jgi:hypothetical protein
MHANRWALKQKILEGTDSGGVCMGEHECVLDDTFIALKSNEAKANGNGSCAVGTARAIRSPLSRSEGVRRAGSICRCLQ